MSVIDVESRVGKAIDSLISFRFFTYIRRKEKYLIFLSKGSSVSSYKEVIEVLSLLKNNLSIYGITYEVEH